MLFETIDTQEALKKSFSYLSPGQAPYYWIIIGLEVFLFKSASDLSGSVWWLAFGLSATLLAVCVLRALAQDAETALEVEAAQLRVARIVGMMAPLLAAAFCLSRARFNEQLSLAMVGAAFFQVFVFFTLVKDRGNAAARSVNVPQLLVICSSLMFSTLFGLANLSSKNLLATLPQDQVVDLVEKAAQEAEAAYQRAHASPDGPAQAASASPAQRMTAQERAALERHFTELRNARAVLDEESPLPMVPMHRLLYEFSPAVADQLKIGAHHVAAARAQVSRFAAMTSLFGAIWLIVLLSTVYHSRRA